MKDGGIYMKNRRIGMVYSFFILPLLVAAVTSFVFASPAWGAHGGSSTKGPHVFKVPGEAVLTLIDTVKTGDTGKITSMLGKGSKTVVSTGNPATDKIIFNEFVDAYEEKNEIRYEAPDKAVLYVGKDERPFPIPLVKKNDRWLFDARAGKEELTNRRIGKNELNAIDVLHGYVDAQREYAAKDRDGDGILEYAQKIVSDKRKKDGLYWDASKDGEESPVGPLVASASQENRKKSKKGDSQVPFFGYYFKILKSQGPNAEGGAYDYVVKDNMIFGFAMIAWPAKYGSTGIMSFIINQSGAVYEKDLGKSTDKMAASINAYDPDKTWKKVVEEKLTGPQSAGK
jgi:hypothetical protein